MDQQDPNSPSQNAKIYLNFLAKEFPEKEERLYDLKRIWLQPYSTAGSKFLKRNLKTVSTLEI